ncbi:DUF1330 domain-containing protein [Erythrobacter ani]|uniref:DUF1330 domain-containing protein n=1 Tax=Erythrobacter ani TaxID=2827235 RepID=A0ABS6SPZ9_9SPHN|nr:DUF1330 domain-containing protein [Erythrobacter ani]MBV7266542.1 DUF1330 domain-containing protein [Erythrobacter ani]
MPEFNTLPLLTTAAAAGLLAACGSPLVPKSALAQPTEAPARAGFTVDLDKGDVLQVIAPQSREDGASTREAYYRQTIPAAEALGFQRHGQLNVRQKVISDWDPGAFIFFSWPDQPSLTAFEARPEWPSVLATRSNGWEELRIFSLELKQDLELQFDPEKHYTVVVAWLNSDGNADYDRYLDGIEPAMARAGGRFVHKLRGPSMEALDAPPGAPGQITFVEWDSTDGFAQVQQSPEYRAHQQYFASGVERFEFYWLETPR